jgi:hypothetical protein
LSGRALLRNHDLPRAGLEDLLAVLTAGTGMTRAAAATEPPSVMPFGRFRDRPLSELPSAYVIWLLKLPDLRDPLKAAIVEEIARRLRRPPIVREVPAEAPVAEIHLGTVDQDGERLPF